MSDQLGVIFDIDGVLVDSYQAHYDSWQQLCRARGLSMTRAQFVTTFGRTSREIIRDFWPHAVTCDADVAAIDEEKEALFRDILRQHVPVMEGAVELIDALGAAGFRLAVGSSAPPANAELSLAGLQRREVFATVITAADVTQGKPHPEVFQRAAAGLGLAPRSCVVIEDAPAGVAAAHAAGAKCIAVVSTGRSADPVRAADLVIHSLRELDPDRIRRLILGP